MSEITKDWELYEAGKNYNNRLSPNYYDTVDTNLAFYNGDQWRNIEDTSMPKPVFNIIKRAINFFVASMTTSKVKIHYEPLMLADEIDARMESELKAADIANIQVKTLFDKFKMEYRIRDALFDGANTGDYAAHFYFDINKRAYNYLPNMNIEGEIGIELIDGTNVFFGNANNPNVDVQPYIIISGRDMVQNLKAEAKQHNQSEDDIKEDSDYNYQAGDNSEIEVEADEYGKALYIIIYRKDKKTGKILKSKSVKNAYIYKDIDTGLNRYPIAWGNWEKIKNSYHGMAIATRILPNQIFINRMFAMVMYHLMMTAFPKAVYNADFIEEFNNEIGAALAISNIAPETNIQNMAGYLKPGDMSNQIVNVIELAMQYTKETLGITDGALGEVDPKNTSAIIAVQKSSAIPLENPKANLFEWIEDIGQILFDMMGTYYGLRPITMEREGQKAIEMFDFSVFKDMYLDVSADVGEASYWSEIAALQTLDNLLAQGHLDIIEYLRRVPDEYIPQKEDLISKLEQQLNNPQELINQLSPEEQQAFYNADPQLQQQMLQQVMGANQG